MITRTPPAEWDRHALEVARGIASIDRSKLPGLTTQFTAILQSAIVDAMMMAAEGTLSRPAITIRCGEIQLNAAGLALTDSECEVLRTIAERMRRDRAGSREADRGGGDVMLTVKLPYPISANRYWHPVRIGPRITIVPTKEAKAYKADVAAICRAHGIRPISGRVNVHIDLYPQRPQDWQKRMRLHGATWDDTVRCLDVDNARKVLYDAMKGIAFDDDAWIWSDSATRREPDGEARVVVTITPIVVEQPQAGLALGLPVADPLEV